MYVLLYTYFLLYFFTMKFLVLNEKNIQFISVSILLIGKLKNKLYMLCPNPVSDGPG